MTADAARGLRAMLAEETRRLERLYCVANETPSDVPANALEQLRRGAVRRGEQLARLPAHVVMLAKVELDAQLAAYQRLETLLVSVLEPKDN